MTIICIIIIFGPVFLIWTLLCEISLMIFSRESKYLGSLHVCSLVCRRSLY